MKSVLWRQAEACGVIYTEDREHLRRLFALEQFPVKREEDAATYKNGRGRVFAWQVSFDLTLWRRVVRALGRAEIDIQLDPEPRAARAGKQERGGDAPAARPGRAAATAGTSTAPAGARSPRTATPAAAPTASSSPASASRAAARPPRSAPTAAHSLLATAAPVRSRTKAPAPPTPAAAAQAGVQDKHGRAVKTAATTAPSRPAEAPVGRRAMEAGTAKQRGRSSGAMETRSLPAEVPAGGVRGSKPRAAVAMTSDARHSPTTSESPSLSPASTPLAPASKPRKAAPKPAPAAPPPAQPAGASAGAKQTAAARAIPRVPAVASPAGPTEKRNAAPAGSGRKRSRAAAPQPALALELPAFPPPAARKAAAVPNRSPARSEPPPAPALELPAGSGPPRPRRGPNRNAPSAEVTSSATRPLAPPSPKLRSQA